MRCTASFKSSVMLNTNANLLLLPSVQSIAPNVLLNINEFAPNVLLCINEFAEEHLSFPTLQQASRQVSQ